MNTGQEKLKIATYFDLDKIPFVENGEEIIDITQALPDCICKYEKFDMIPYMGENLWARKTIADKLKNVSDSLQSKFPGFQLKIVYGYRHPKIQEEYFLKQKELLRNIYISASENELDELTHSFVAMPEIAGHPTGGAIDLTITTPDGDLDMGTKIADFSDPLLIKTFSNQATALQLSNRKLLHDLMIEQNFAPFYGEWWHFSFGDKEWAWFYDQPNAIFDQIELRKNASV